MKTNLMLSIATSSLLLLSACSESGMDVIDDGVVDDTPDVVTAIETSGKAIDGYLRFSTVCLDLNKNSKCDTDEPSATTDRDGNYGLYLTADHQAHANFNSADVIVYGGQDSDTGKNFVGSLSSSYDANSTTPLYVSPLTTLASSLQKSDTTLSAAQAQQKVADILGLSLAQVTADPVDSAKNGDTEVLSKALELQKAVEVLATNSGNTQAVYDSIASGLGNASVGTGVSGALDNASGLDATAVSNAKVLVVNVALAVSNIEAGNITKAIAAVSNTIEKVKKAVEEDVKAGNATSVPLTASEDSSFKVTVATVDREVVKNTLENEGVDVSELSDSDLDSIVDSGASAGATVAEIQAALETASENNANLESVVTELENKLEGNAVLYTGDSIDVNNAIVKLESINENTSAADAKTLIGEAKDMILNSTDKDAEILAEFVKLANLLDSAAFKAIFEFKTEDGTIITGDDVLNPNNGFDFELKATPAVNTNIQTLLLAIADRAKAIRTLLDSYTQADLDKFEPIADMEISLNMLKAGSSAVVAVADFASTYTYGADTNFAADGDGSRVFEYNPLALWNDSAFLAQTSTTKLAEAKTYAVEALTLGKAEIAVENANIDTKISESGYISERYELKRDKDMNTFIDSFIGSAISNLDGTNPVTTFAFINNDKIEIDLNQLFVGISKADLGVTLEYKCESGSTYSQIKSQLANTPTCNDDSEADFDIASIEPDGKLSVEVYDNNVVITAPYSESNIGDSNFNTNYSSDKTIEEATNISPVPTTLALFTTGVYNANIQQDSDSGSMSFFVNKSFIDIDSTFQEKGDSAWEGQAFDYNATRFETNGIYSEYFLIGGAWKEKTNTAVEGSDGNITFTQYSGSKRYNLKEVKDVSGKDMAHILELDIDDVFPADSEMYVVEDIQTAYASDYVLYNNVINDDQGVNIDTLDTLIAQSQDGNYTIHGDVWGQTTGYSGFTIRLLDSGDVEFTSDSSSVVLPNGTWSKQIVDTQEILVIENDAIYNVEECHDECRTEYKDTPVFADVGLGDGIRQGRFIRNQGSYSYEGQRIYFNYQARDAIIDIYNRERPNISGAPAFNQ